MIPLIIAFIIIEWIGREKQYALAIIGNRYMPVRWAFYIVLIGLIHVFTGTEQQFIYFQF